MQAQGTIYLYKSMTYDGYGIFSHSFSHNVIATADC